MNEARGFPPATLLLGGAIIAAHVALSLAPATVQDWVFYRFAVFPVRFAPHNPDSFAHWYDAFGPLFGSAFLHAPGLTHIGFNMMALIQAAPIVEHRVGAWRFLMIFFVAAAAGAACYVAINPGSTQPAVGASGAICGIFAAYFLSVRANWREALREPMVRNGVLFFLLLNVGLAAVARMTGALPIAWEAHLGGFIGGAGVYLALRRRVAPGPWGGV